MHELHETWFTPRSAKCMGCMRPLSTSCEFPNICAKKRETGNPRRSATPASRRAGKTQSSFSIAAPLPITAASWPVVSPQKAIRPCRWSASMRWSIARMRCMPR